MYCHPQPVAVIRTSGQSYPKTWAGKSASKNSPAPPSSTYELKPITAMGKKRKEKHNWTKEAELIADAFVQRKRIKTLKVAQEQAEANTTLAANGTANLSGLETQNDTENPLKRPDDERDSNGDVDQAPAEPKKLKAKISYIPKPSKEERKAMKKERKNLKRELKAYNKAKHANKHRHMEDPYKKMEEMMTALGPEEERDVAKMRRSARRQVERESWKKQIEEQVQQRTAQANGGFEPEESNDESENESDDNPDDNLKPNSEDEESDSEGESEVTEEEDEGDVNDAAENERPISAAAARILGSVYVEHPSLTATPQKRIDDYVAEHLITISDTSSYPKYRPTTKFAHLPLTDGAHRTIFAQFKDPTPIQAAAWPYAIAGRDVIGIAETGSGKTLAFGSPCVRHISSIPRGGKRRGIRAVIITPTRELACQIFEYMKKLGSRFRLGVVCLYGGVAKEPQRGDLETASIVVATPGRLQDLIDEGSADMSRVSYLVLDEADRMLEKGFDEDIRKIIQTMPKSGRERQTLMFTATWPPSIRELAATYMTDPVRIGIGDNPNGELRANTRITQSVEVVLPSQKYLRLLQILKKNMRGEGQDRILVFCLYKKEAFKVEVFLKRKDLRVVSIHGDLSQTQRTTNLRAFKDGYVPILVATDVASRGLDIPNVNLVVNMTFPLTVEDYVHRIGR